MSSTDDIKLNFGPESSKDSNESESGSLDNLLGDSDSLFDFDFGSLLLFRTAALKRYLAESPENFEYAGLYQLRLAMSRVGKIYHHDGYVYTGA